MDGMTCLTCDQPPERGSVCNTCRERHEIDAIRGAIALRLNQVPEIAERWAIPRSEARRHVVMGTCPCSGQGANPCHEMGGEAECIGLPPIREGVHGA